MPHNAQRGYLPSKFPSSDLTMHLYSRLHVVRFLPPPANCHSDPFRGLGLSLGVLLVQFWQGKLKREGSFADIAEDVAIFVDALEWLKKNYTGARELLSVDPSVFQIITLTRA